MKAQFTTASPANVIKSVTVRRRTAIPTHGWNEEEFKPQSRIPSMEELVYKIYDTQREIIASIYPKRFNCNVIATIANIEKMNASRPGTMTFDGMSYSAAIVHFEPQMKTTGIMCKTILPFILANEIKVTNSSFAEGYSHIFRKENGLWKMVLSTVRDFAYLSTNRQIVNNLSFHLNMEYNCNLHLTFEEQKNILQETGKLVDSNRQLFNQACDYYIHPTKMDFVTFVRCQVPRLRGADHEHIIYLVNNTDDLLDDDPLFAHEIDRAKAIYRGVIKNWVGDFSKETILG